jgi:hypothetical protein
MIIMPFKVQRRGEMSNQLIADFLAFSELPG